MPRHGKPYLAQYYLVTFIIASLSLVSTTLTLNVFHRNTRAVPKWLHFIAKRKKDKEEKEDEEKPKEPEPPAPPQSPNAAGPKVWKRKWSRVRQMTQAPDPKPIVTDVLKRMEEIREQRKKEWSRISRVMDRVFFFTYSITMLIAFFTIFLRAPRFSGYDPF